LWGGGIGKLHKDESCEKKGLRKKVVHGGVTTRLRVAKRKKQKTGPTTSGTSKPFSSRGGWQKVPPGDGGRCPSEGSVCPHTKAPWAAYLKIERGGEKP